MNNYSKCRAILFAASCVVLSACQTAPSAPEYKYYRLLPSAISPAPSLQSMGDLGVRPLRADGLYTERAIIFSDEQQRRLQQYHYHYWMYPPGQLIQENLAELLSQGRPRPVVKLAEFGGEALYAISGRIVRFEKITVAGQAKASVVLELGLEKKNKILWQQTYAADEVVAGTAMTGFSAAVEVALDRIYTQFLGDLGRVKTE
jgi:ABC-type uncharacterized transport system auxiliary subunit